MNKQPAFTFTALRDTDPYVPVVVVDLDTGTILGRNVVAVFLNDIADRDADSLTNDDCDSEAVRIASTFGKPLYVLKGE